MKCLNDLVKIFLVLNLGIVSNSAFGQFNEQVDLPPRQLELLIQKAQEAYFSGEDQGQARAYFEQVAHLKNAHPWESEQKKVIHFSMLRLAQLSVTPETTDFWLKESLSFAPEFSPDPELFPPPLTAKFSELKKLHLQKTAQIDLPRVHSLPHSSHQQSLTNDTNQAPYTEELAQPLKQAPLWKNKWVWIGAGVLAAGYFAYDQSRQRKEEPSRSVTYGF